VGRMPRLAPRWPWDDPLRALQTLTSLWSSAGLPSVSAGAAAPYRTLFTTLKRLLVGREIRVRVDHRDIALTVTEFDSPLDPLGLAVGQLGEVLLAARDMRWDQHRFDHVTAVLHNVHVPPLLLAAPVELSAAVSAELFDAVLRQAAPQLCGELRADGTARVHWARRPALGSLEVDVQAVGSTLWLKPHAVVIRRRRWPLPAQVPVYPVGLPALPRGLLVTGVSFGSDSLQLSGLLPEWRMELPLSHLEDVITYLTHRAGAGALSLAWPSLRRSSE
jgi:hypothetical protein